MYIQLIWPRRVCDTQKTNGATLLYCDRTEVNGADQQSQRPRSQRKRQIEKEIEERERKKERKSEFRVYIPLSNGLFSDRGENRFARLNLHYFLRG